MTTTTVIDTVYHIFYDTIHTSVFDTVHTVSFDTVKVVLDSSFTPQLLRDSQAFYSWAFIAVITIIGLGTGILAFVLNKLWDKKVDIAVDKLKQDFSQIAEEKAKNAAKIAADDAANSATEKTTGEFKNLIEKQKEKFEKLVEEQRDSLESLNNESSILWTQQISECYLLAKRENNPVYFVEKMIFLMDKIMLKQNETIVHLLNNLFLPELKKAIYSLPFADGFDKIAIMVYDGLNNIKNSIKRKNFEEGLTVSVCASIDEIMSEMTKRLEEYNRRKKECDEINGENQSLNL